MYCDRDYIESTDFEAQIAHTVEITEGMYTFVEISDTGTGISEETFTRTAGHAGNGSGRCRRLNTCRLINRSSWSIDAA